MSVKGRVLRIERSSNKDGDGLRTVIFFKGCPLSCKWCSTPESQELRHEIGFVRAKCARCRKCESACQQHAIGFASEKGVFAVGTNCSGCGVCVKLCPNSALKLYGRDMTSDEVVHEITKDDVFFCHGGGVTLSGGEVLMQPDFALEILKGVADVGIDRTIETCAFAKWEHIEPLLEYLHSMFIDIKIMDTEKHKYYTGADNGLILDNVKKIDARGQTRITVRVPFVPGVNDDRDNFEKLASFCGGLKHLAAVEILPYHRLGIDTYRYLDRKAVFADTLPPTREMIEDKIEPLRKAGDIKVKFGM